MYINWYRKLIQVIISGHTINKKNTSIEHDKIDKSIQAMARKEEGGGGGGGEKESTRKSDYKQHYTVNFLPLFHISNHTHTHDSSVAQPGVACSTIIRHGGLTAL